MSTAITLWCDGDAEPRCRAEFGPYLRAPSEVRKMAAEAGWTSRPMPGLSRYQRFREDFCPDHKPPAASGEGVPTEEER